MTGRRAFVTGAAALLATPAAALAQPAKPLRRIALLCTTACGVTGSERGLPWFIAQLKALGYEDGRNVFVDFRGAGISEPELERVVAHLLRLKVDVIVVAGSSSALGAARRATTRVPIVMAIGEDAVESGFVTSLAKPGGNITGVSTPYAQLIVKQLEILRELAPAVRQLGVLATRGNRSHDAALKRLQAVADQHKIGVQVERISVPHSNLPESLRRLGQAGIQSLLILPEPLLLRGGEVALFGLDRRIPTISTFSEFADGAGLIAYGPSADDLLARAARYVDRILKGAHPGDLPVEQPTAFRLTINATTAKALALTIPTSLLLRADRVIE